MMTDFPPTIYYTYTNPVPLFLSAAVVHSLTDMCFKKCITGAIKGGKLDRTEEGCMANCADRFLDVSSLTMKQLQNMRG